MPLELRPGPDPLRAGAERVLALQEEIAALLGPREDVPLQSVTVGLVVPPSAWQVSAGERGVVRDRARVALDRAAERLGLAVVTEPEETVTEDERGGVVVTLTAGGRPS